jgi:hypothetical protein
MIATKRMAATTMIMESELDFAVVMGVDTSSRAGRVKKSSSLMSRVAEHGTERV